MSTETLGMICGARHSRRRLSLACRCSRLAIRICQVTGLRGTHSLSDSPHVLTASCLVLRRVEAGPEVGVGVTVVVGLVPRGRERGGRLTRPAADAQAGIEA